MATIKNLPNRSISTMNEEELIDHIMAMRKSRRTPKASMKKKSTPKTPPVKSTGDILSMLSPTQAEALLEKLKGGQDG